MYGLCGRTIDRVKPATQRAQNTNVTNGQLIIPDNQGGIDAPQGME